MSKAMPLGNFDMVMDPRFDDIMTGDLDDEDFFAAILELHDEMDK